METAAHNHDTGAADMQPHHCGGDGGHGHAMVFHTSVHQEILFSGWVTSSALELFGSAVAIFVASVLYEGFKYYRDVLYEKAAEVTRDSQVNIAKNESGQNRPCARPAASKSSMCSTQHIIQTCLYFVQATVSYLLMLIFMTYNVWLCLALVLGLAVGFFFFGWKRSTARDTSECCM
ncbi:unnamed protein product [Leptidea sinapis]|nr:unnamed protein product [Leptidea sinapis]